MQMIQCPNCGKLTGFKRALGFGTFFMVLLTCGLWLLAIPFYPARCMSCGLTRGSAFTHNFTTWYRGLSPAAKALVLILPALLFFGLVMLNSFQNSRAQHNPQNDGPTTDLSPASGDAESVIRISAKNLIAEFQQSEADKELRIKRESLSTYLNDKTETADDRYKGKRIQVTGIVTGVFIPSIGTSRRVLESRGKGISDEQGGAGSFITMGGPYPHSVEETLLLPGIEAWSKTGDSLQPLFGQPNIESLAGRLVVGKQASILCTFRSSSGSSPTEVSISLEDCILESSPPLSAPTVPAPVAAQSIEEPNQKSEADMLYQQKRYSEALPLFDQGCTAGNGEACKGLGVLYANGLGVAQDLPRAAELFSKSCNKGNVRGCFNLGVSYKSGRGVKQNYSRAATLFSQSCNGGDAMGCEALGIMYELGIGLAKDASRAASLYSKACSEGNANGCNHLGKTTENQASVTKDKLDEASRIMVAIIEQKVHPAPLDASFTAPQISSVDKDAGGNRNVAGGNKPTKGISGQVVLVCVIDPNGKCQHWDVLKSIDPTEDQAVIRGLLGVHFLPATEYGHPIAYPYVEKVALKFAK
jgi:hypothetical protein